MLRLFGPDCPIAPFDPASGPIPECAVWIDLLSPTPEEEKAAEAFIGMSIPTRDEMVEIEPSSRLYERRGAQFMTMSVLYGIDDNEPGSDPVSFILTDKHLVTLRYVDGMGRPVTVSSAPGGSVQARYDDDGSSAPSPIGSLATSPEALRAPARELAGEPSAQTSPPYRPPAAHGTWGLTKAGPVDIASRLSSATRSGRRGPPGLSRT